MSASLLDNRVDRDENWDLRGQNSGEAWQVGNNEGGRAVSQSVAQRKPRPEARVHPNKVRKQVRLHLAHHLTSVHLHGDFADAKFSTDLLCSTGRRRPTTSPHAHAA